MKLFIFLLSTFSMVCLADVTIPDSGMYRCVDGNDESICDQKLRTIMKEGKLSAVKVIYEGYCNGQGPYTYYCDDKSCSYGAIHITYRDQSHYLWENRAYSFHCEMQKIQ